MILCPEGHDYLSLNTQPKHFSDYTSTSTGAERDDVTIWLDS